MAYEKQTWKDRQVQYPNRYIDQNGNILQLERSPGTVTENGSLFNAERMNHIEDGIKDVDSRVQTNKTNIENNLKKIKGDLLWTNSNSLVGFAAQNITLSSDDYDVLEFYYNNDLTAPTMDTIKVQKGFGAHMSYMSNGSLRWWARRISYVDDTTFSVPDCVLINSSGLSVDNDKCIPLYVIGYKIELFEVSDE